MKNKSSFNYFNSLFFAPIQFKITTGSNSRGVRPMLHVSWNKSEKWIRERVCPPGHCYSPRLPEQVSLY